MSDDATSDGRNQPRNGHGRFAKERTPEQADFDRQVCELRLSGMSYEAIGDEMGCSASTAFRAVERAYVATVRAPVELLREQESQRLDVLLMAAWKVLKARHLIVSHGRVVRRRVLDSDGLFIVVGGDDDNPVYAEEELVDHKPVLEAIQTVVKIMERRSKLWGLDAPKRYETLTVDRIDAQIAELEAELAAAGVDLEAA